MPTANTVRKMGAAALGRSFGNSEGADGDRAVETFAIGPWVNDRPFRLAGGRELTGHARTIHKIRIPVLAKVWHGLIVAADVGGHRMVNDRHGGG